MTSVPYGFRIVGAPSEPRRLVEPAAAFAGYASCDPRAQVEKEAYLSAFTFGLDFRQLLETTDSTRGFNGVCGADWVWWDIDREGDLALALKEARRLVYQIEKRFDLEEEEILVFYSGSKGFHVGLSIGLWSPMPSVHFNKVARRFAERLAESAQVAVDTGIYDKVRAFRAPNSRHPKSGLHKRWLSFDTLMGLAVGEILRLAESPEPFDVPTPSRRSQQAVADWLEAEAWVREQAEAKAKRQLATNGAPRLNRQTLDFIRNGAEDGDRHRLLFSSAANLAEFGCSPALAHALLTEAGLDTGLPPSEVRRQIDTGLDHGGKGRQSA